VDLNRELASYAKMAEAEMARYLTRPLDELYAPLRDLMARGGKRLRPALCMAACEAVGGKRADALKVAAFIEMVHNFTLIHDDIADRSELRRGQPCLHHEYGLGLAINSGDGLFSTAYEVLSDATADLDDKRAKRLWALLPKSVTEVCEGQAMDITWVERKRWDLTEKDYFEMIRRKTGALMSAACEAGAIVGGGSEKEIKALRDFGMGIGVGFQIHDDVLNLRADVKRYGKEIGGDINEGKRTLIVIYTLSACTPQERKLLINILDKGKNSPDEIKAAIEIIEKYGSIDRTSELSREMVEDGKKGLGALPESGAKRLLLEIADYLVKRDF
jgi:geranylgeranyl pyrophosphate synthase